MGCEEHGVQGFPTIKYGDPAGLEDYEGGRGFDELKKFAEENLKPSCSPTNVDLCDDEMKSRITELEAMSPADLEKEINEKSKEIKDAEDEFEKEVESSKRS